MFGYFEVVGCTTAIVFVIGRVRNARCLRMMPRWMWLLVMAPGMYILWMVTARLPLYRSSSSPSSGRHLYSKCAPALNKPEIDARMQKLIGPEVKADDPEVIDILRGHFLERPLRHMTKLSMPLRRTPQAKEVDILLKRKRRGFFVECGALDGERSSNTLWLERERGWDGLLVEMDPSYYLQIRGKNRRATTANVCLSPLPYPVKLPFLEHQMGEGRLESASPNQTSHYPVRTHIKATQSSHQAPPSQHAYCFPLESLMSALNRTRIDYLSLDVEGAELPILRTIPFDRLDIAVLSVEFKHGPEGEKGYVDLMRERGYRVHKRLVYAVPELYLGGSDFIFVKDQ